MSTTSLSIHIRAPRTEVYTTLLDANAIAQWRVPDGMTCHIHTFEPRDGGQLRISLSYNSPDGTGKTTAHTDTYHGHFAKLIANEQIVEIDEFETDDPTLKGAMTVTISLSDADGGTDLVAVHEGVPEGVSPGDNQTGWRMALEKLKAVVESKAS